MTSVCNEGPQITVLLDAKSHGRVADVLSREREINVADLESFATSSGAGAIIALVGEESDYAQMAVLKSGKPPFGIIVLSERPTRLLGTALLAGGVSCVPSDLAPAELVEAVRLTAGGDCVFRPVTGDAEVRPALRLLGTLTHREKQVLACLWDKQKAAEIAFTLEIGVETVRTHLASVRRKLGVKSNRELEALDPSFRL